MDKLRILLTNDDGILSAGLNSLIRVFKNIGDIYVSAPEVEQSGSGHSITLSGALSAKEINIPHVKKAWAIKGTPADSVKLALSTLLDFSPDIVISGINSGPNVGVSILYSGTVGAAAEAAIQGIPAMAVSLGIGRDGNFDTAAEYAKEILEKVTLSSFPHKCVLNINVPAIPRSMIKGIRITRHSDASFNEFYERVRDPWGREFFWINGELKYEHLPDIDAFVVNNGYVSITPLHFDWTANNVIQELSKIIE